MRTCDLCEEFSMADMHCDECGHRMESLPPRAPIPDPPPNRFPPIEAVAAPVRARHRETLGALAEWVLVEGRGFDRATAALCVDVIGDHCGADGEPLDRRGVNRIVYGGIRNRATRAGTLLPDGWMSDLWTVLRFLADTGRLAPGSDPEPALLEPLQCYGGLGADGRPRPEGVDVDFPCQCHLPHDPTCPPSARWRNSPAARGRATRCSRSRSTSSSTWAPSRRRRRHRSCGCMGSHPWSAGATPRCSSTSTATPSGPSGTGVAGEAEWVFERPEPGTIIWDAEHDEACDPARA